MKEESDFSKAVRALKSEGAGGKKKRVPKPDPYLPSTFEVSRRKREGGREGGREGRKEGRIGQCPKDRGERRRERERE